MSSWIYMVGMIVIAITASITVVSIVIIRPFLNRWLDIKDKEQKIKKFELYNKVNADTVNEVLDKYVDTYISRYIVYKFVANKVPYIKQEDTEKMIKDITKEILIEISDLYLYYISLVYGYSNDQELAAFILNRVSNSAIDSVSNFNRSNGFDNE